MPKVRMRNTAAGPDGAFQAGKEYDVSGDLGTALVSSGAAEWASPRVEQAVTEPPETRRDLSDLTKAELEELAEAEGVDVARRDGKDLPPRKSDYQAALA